MTRSLLLSALLSCAAAQAATDPAPEQKPAETPKTRPDEGVEKDRQPVVALPSEKPPQPDHAVDTSINSFRTPVDALTERAIGSASKSVRFDWRRTKVGLAVLGSELLERNNFGSARVGGLVRHPFGSFMGELAVTHVWTWDTDSSRKLALTPYRQYGRPSRYELDLNLGFPLAEGVVTAWPDFFPAAELVFSAKGGVRYLYYPGAFDGMRFADAAKAAISPRLADRERRNVELQTPGGMLLDSGRYGLMGGLSLDVYFQPGVFFEPKVMIALPILAPATGTGLGLWYEISAAVGYAF